MTEHKNTPRTPQVFVASFTLGRDLDDRNPQIAISCDITFDADAMEYRASGHDGLFTSVGSVPAHAALDVFAQWLFTPVHHDADTSGFGLVMARRELDGHHTLHRLDPAGTAYTVDATGRVHIWAPLGWEKK